MEIKINISGANTFIEGTGCDRTLIIKGSDTETRKCAQRMAIQLIQAIATATPETEGLGEK